MTNEAKRVELEDIRWELGRMCEQRRWGRFVRADEDRYQHLADRELELLQTA